MVNRTLSFMAMVVAGWLTPLSSGLGQQTPATLATFLREGIGLSSGEVSRMEKGQPVVKVLDTKNREDIAVFGIVALTIPRLAYLERLRDFRTSLRTPTRVAHGVFSDPAAAADVAALVIDSQDVADLPRCRTGECKLKLPAVVMDEVQRQVNWNGPAARAEVSAYARRRVVEYVTDYRARGDAAMVVYDDRGNRRASDAFRDLLAQSPYIYQYAPTLQQYLAEYPRRKLEGVTEVMYWAVDSMSSLRPILNVNHLALYSPPELPGTTLLATKQIFANHYFEALFDLTSVIDRPRAAGGGAYLISIRRFRFDRMPSAGPVSLKGKVAGKLKEQMESDLVMIRGIRG